MALTDIIPIIGSVITIGLGAVGLIRPMVLANASGLETTSELGISELRALFGAVIIVLGISALAFRNPTVYLVTGMAFIAAGAVKVVSIAVDKAPVKLALPGILFDFVVGLALASGYVWAP